jgi:hypothetical protein
LRRSAGWRRTKDQKIRRFSADDESLFGIFGLTIDEARGALRRVVRVPNRGDHQTHVIGDLALAPDGGIFLPDSGAPVLWWLPPRAESVEVFTESPEFLSFQGAVVASDRCALFVADYASGLLRVDLTTRAVRRLELPPDTTLNGIERRSNSVWPPSRPREGWRTS